MVWCQALPKAKATGRKAGEILSMYRNLWLRGQRRKVFRFDTEMCGCCRSSWRERVTGRSENENGPHTPKEHAGLGCEEAVQRPPPFVPVSSLMMALASLFESWAMFTLPAVFMSTSARWSLDRPNLRDAPWMAASCLVVTLSAGEASPGACSFVTGRLAAPLA